MSWPIANWQLILAAAGDHLLLGVPAILLSVVIAVPIGRLAFRSPRIGGPLLTIASLAYAIPALPLLILVPALIGTALRSWETMVVALTVYGVALLVRTACDAFTAVDPQLRDAAVAIGHSPRSVFWKVDLPLAIPVLISGIRVVAVSTISLVTIGALIGVRSLGSLLTDGFQRGIAAEIWSGIVVTVVLALVIDAIVLGVGRALTPWTRRAAGQSSRSVAPRLETERTDESHMSAETAPSFDAKAAPST